MCGITVELVMRCQGNVPTLYVVSLVDDTTLPRDSSVAEQEPHKLQVAGSNPAPAKSWLLPNWLGPQIVNLVCAGSNPVSHSTVR